MDEAKPHAVMVPGPGLGHVNGCLLLAKALIPAGFSVTLACFQRSYNSHASKGRIAASHPSIHLHVLPDDLPPESDSSSSYADLFQVTPSMHANLLHLLQQRPATCLISDTIMGWTQHVADLVGIPRVDYWTATATSYLTILALPDLLEKGYVGCHQGPTPSSWKIGTLIFVDVIPGFPNFPLDEIPNDFRHAYSKEDPLLQRFLEGGILAKHAHSVLVHSMYDLERDAFQSVQNILNIEAFSIGPLIYQYDTISSTKSTNNPSLKWLDAHPPSSVIYVSFGSNFVHTSNEIVELAHGLEASGKAFLWVIRSDSMLPGCELNDVLPYGFCERTSKRGLIVPWASQLDVLAHPAVGGFLSHCGWNSTLESMWMGVPMLACPKRAEQPINCRLISKEWGNGIELETTNDGTFSRHHIKIGICNLLDELVGNQAREKARELSQLLRKTPFEGGKSHSDLLKFTSTMKEKCLQYT